MKETSFQRDPLQLRPDPTRVIVRPFRPATEPRDLNPIDRRRADNIITRVLSLNEAQVAQQLSDILDNFDRRHRNLLQIFDARALDMEQALSAHASFSDMQRHLVGAYFLSEYSFEASALFNPSIVAHPDQSGVDEGSLRFVLSVRAVGEGHVSSLTFRTGLVGPNGEITLDATARLASLPRILNQLQADDFTFAFSSQEEVSERVIFPMTSAQSNGIEDARFVAFEDSGTSHYYATFTAYDGRNIRSELLETDDFQTFRMRPLHGSAAGNKGMALFPRQIGARYAMIARQDNENLFLLYSSDITLWNDGAILLKPEFPWEFVQIGNCGSPIELDEGWLLLTHGVGPMRKYAVGATLLDKSDPSIVLGRTGEPLLHADETERSGYVPNVVYTCGGMRHRNRIILPYAIADTYCSFASIEIGKLLARL